MMKNKMLREKIKNEKIKKRIIGNWGKKKGINLIYENIKRIIKKRKENVIYIWGKGNGGKGMVEKKYMEGKY